MIRVLKEFVNEFKRTLNLNYQSFIINFMWLGGRAL